MRARSAIRLLLLASGALLVAPTSPARAQVTSTNDSGPGTLREALDAAVADTEITFSLAPTQTILVSSPLVVNLGGIEIDGTGAPGLTVSETTATDVILSLDLESGDSALEIVDVNLSDGVVELDGELVYTTNNDTTLDVEIRDLSGGTLRGALTKRGTASLTVDSNGVPLSYTGGTQVEAGTLALAPGTTLSSDALASVAISSGATLRMDVDAAGATLGGELSGAGTLELEGTPGFVLFFLDAGSFAGNLEINDDILVVDRAGVVQGDVLLGSATAQFAIKSSATVPGDISGVGTLFANAGAGGAVTLTGSNSHANTVVFSGTLVGDPDSLVGDISLPAADRLLRIQGSGSLTADISGSGSVEKIGADTVVLLGNHTYNGSTTVAAGTLDLLANLATTSLVVGSGGTLAGLGTASSAALDVSGTLAPSNGSNAIGSLTVMDASFQPGSTLRIDVQNSSSDRLIASGNIAAGSATLVVNPLPGDYSGVGHDVTVLQSTGGMVTSVPTLPTNFAFLTLTPMSTASTFGFNIQADLSDVAALASNPNQRVVAQALQPELDAVGAGHPFEELQQNLVALEAGQVPAAFDALGGESHSAFQAAHLSASQRFERTLHRRSRGRSWVAESALLDPDRESQPQSALRHVFAMSPGSGLASIEEPLWGAWIEGWGGLGRLGADDGADVDHRLAGLGLGFDAPLGPLRVGLAAAYGYANLELDDFEIDTFAHSAHVAAYVGASGELGYLNLAGRFLYARNHSEREIAISGLLATADADFDTLGGGLGVEGGLNLLRLGPAVVQPIASFAWTRLEQASFDESGAGPLDLDVDSESIDALQTGLGLRVGARFDVDGGVEMVPELRARWLHDFGDVERSVTSRFEGATVSAPFQLEGAEGPRDALLAGLGWSGVVSPNLRVHADYDVLYGADRLDHLLTVGGEFSF